MAEHNTYDLPPTFKGLQVRSPTEPLAVVDLPTPLPTAGTVILRPLYSPIVSYSKYIYCNGNTRGFRYSLPLVPGSSAICRIAAPAPDTPYLKRGMLVFTSGIIRPRDNDNTMPLLVDFMGSSPEGEALIRGEWRNGAWAELVKVPAENVYVLNEQVLTKDLGYNVRDLGHLNYLAIAYSGLSDVGLQPGETIIIAPATGTFGSAAVLVALAMGAGKVIAMGRSREKLQQVKERGRGRVEIVALTGNAEEDATTLQAHGTADVYFDISPDAAATSSHFESAIAALRLQGRMSMMGGIQGDIMLPYLTIMLKGLTLKGSFMYTRKQTYELIRLIETGLLPIGDRGGLYTSGVYPLSKWADAFERASEEMGPGKATYFVPNEQ